jgi:hypothetical protein
MSMCERVCGSPVLAVYACALGEQVKIAVFYAPLLANWVLAVVVSIYVSSRLGPSLSQSFHAKRQALVKERNSLLAYTLFWATVAGLYVEGVVVVVVVVMQCMLWCVLCAGSYGKHLNQAFHAVLCAMPLLAVAVCCGCLLRLSVAVACCGCLLRLPVAVACCGCLLRLPAATACARVPL